MPNNFRLEVIITRSKNGVLATAPYFPTCSGIGTDDREALRKLGLSISRFMFRKINNAVSTTLSSTQYTQIVPGNKHDSDGERRVFYFNGADMSIGQMAPPQSEAPDQSDIPPSSEALFSDLENTLNESSGRPFLPKHIQVPHQDGVVFGFPMCLN